MSLLIPLTLGLFSTLHCVGMCGGIVGALTLGTPPRARWRLIVTCNLGRVLSYTAAGAITGALTGTAAARWFPSSGHFWLSILAAVILALAGLQIAGWFNLWTKAEVAAGGLWKRLQAVIRRLLPLRTLHHALLFGTLWGWLPCGLVYSALALAAASGDAAHGALYMFCFGVGTLPGVVGLGLVSARALPVLQRPELRQIAGVALILVGLVTLWMNLQHANHSHATSHHQHAEVRPHWNVAA